MPKFRKDVLKAGRYSVPSKDGKSRRLLVYTGADVKHLARRHAEMKAAGLHVPACWEHQDDAKPDAAERLARRAKHNFGFAECALEDGDTLSFELDVPRDEDASQLPAVRYVSPEIVTDWIDGSGRLWPGKSITHIAATSRPVQHAQQPFERLSLNQSDNVVRLSLADRLGEAPMADELDLDTGSDTGSEAGESSGSKHDVKDALSKLQAFGIHIPDDTTEENFFERLCVALHALDNAKGGGESDMDADNDIAAAPEEPTPAPAPASSPVMMSLQRRVALLEKQNVDMHREKLKARTVTLHRSGRISKPIRDKLLAEISTERLSLADDGKLGSATVTTKIEAYEALDAGAASPVLLSTDRDAVPTPVENPEEVARRAEMTDTINKLSRGRYQPATNGKN